MTGTLRFGVSGWGGHTLAEVFKGVYVIDLGRGSLAGGVILVSQYQDQSDEFLVKQCLRGDSVAWYCLVQRYKRLIYHFPLKSTLPDHDCDEVFQETLLALHQNLESIKRLDNISYWISRVSQRITWKWLHREKERAEIPEPLHLEDPTPHAQEQLELAIQQFKIRRALAQLDEKCGKLLTMLFYEADESDYKKITKELGIAIGSVGPTRNRCLNKFKKILKKFGLDENNVSNWL